MPENPEDERMDEALRRLWQGDSSGLDGILKEEEGEESSFGEVLGELGEQAQAYDPCKPDSSVGNYKIIRKIAAGGMGAVYEVEQQNPKRRAALKTINPLQVSPIIVRRFALEAEILGWLRHPGIAEIFEAGAFDAGRGPQPFFAMELVRGENLLAFAEKHELDVRQRIELFIKVCDAVQFAHWKGVIHRDLKPDNILVNEFNQPKILDFGVARLTHSAMQRETLHTQPGLLIGTIDYMSPEQFSLTHFDLDARSDVYALGVILYQLLSGRLPYPLEEKSLPEKSRIITETPALALGAVDKKFRGDLEKIVSKVLEKEPARRYQSAADLAADLHRFLNGERPHIEAPTTIEQLRRFVSRHKVPVAAALVVVLTVTIGFAVSTRLYFVAEDRLSNFNRLADVNDLKTLTEQARRISTDPKNVPELKRWVDRSRNLLEHLPLHRQTLLELRAHALPYTEVEKAKDRATHPRLAELDDMIRYRSYMESSNAGKIKGGAEENPGMSIKEQLALQKKKIEALESEIGQRRAWEFSDPQDRWQHEVLTKLVSDLEQFADPQNGLVARVEKQLAFASQVVAQSVQSHATDWERAIDSIANPTLCPKYNGLRISSQPGLVPLGQDSASGLWEFCHLETGEIPTRDAAGQLVRTENMGLVFVLLPAGNFVMGVSSTEVEALEQEGGIPQNSLFHEQRPQEIQLEPFFISKFEMTQGQWLRASNSNPSMFNASCGIPFEKYSLLNPVETVNWYEADELLTRLNLTLPTEAQWEYAARAGTKTLWWTGSNKESLRGAANIGDRSYHERTPVYVGESWIQDGYAAHAPIGSLSANPFGLHDVYGNVAEWTYDGSGPKEIPVKPGNGLRIAGEGGAGYRVVRGGAFHNGASSCRSGFSDIQKPELRNEYIGVRPARTLQK